MTAMPINKVAKSAEGWINLQLAGLAALIFALVAATPAARADDIVDLEGGAISKTAAEFKADYNGKTIENGAVEVTSAHDNTNMADGTYKIGNNAVLTSGTIHQNGNLNLEISNGGKYISTDYLTMPFRYGNQTLELDNGTFSHTSSNKPDGVPQTVCIGYTWNNKDESKTDISARVVVDNNSVFELTAKGNLALGQTKGKEKAVKTMKVEFEVTNSKVSLSNGQIVLSSSTSGWISDTANSYVKAIFGAGSEITCNQIYAYPNPAPTVSFDGAKLIWNGNNSSFIGQNSGVSGDIYTIGKGGLAIDIPSGKALTTDGNSSALKGEGGITKLGEGSLTWKSISSKGSKKHLFTGPLVVREGSWTSSLGYAASAFRAEGGDLTLSGALEAANVALAATDGGTLTLVGATITDVTPDLTLAGGGTTDYFTRDGAVTAYTLGTLTLRENAVLDLDGDSTGVDTISATALALSATVANKVAISFSDAANVLGGTYNLITITGGGTFASGDEAKFSLDANLPQGSALSLSQDLTTLVLTVPASNPATWTGGANDNDLLSPMNWLGKVVPGADADVIIGVDSATTLTCNDAFSVNSITFPATSAQVTISGSGRITNATKIVNVSEARPVINVPVEFVANDAYAAIDVTGEVDFQGGVTGTIPANHTTFYGNYTLTATSWTLSEAITLAEGAKVKAEGMTINISTANSKFICAEPGSSLELVGIKTTKTGDVFGSYKGVLHVGSITIDTGSSNTSSFQFGTSFTGVLKIGHFLVYPGTGAVWAFPYATVVMGGTGFHLRRGSLPLGGISSGQTVDEYVIHSSADWTMKVENGNDYNFAISLSAPHIVVDTSDYGGDADGHTVTIKHESKAQAAARLLEGPGALAASGNGALVFQNTCYFTGGLTASNSVTVGVNAGVSPGNGNVTLKDTSILDLRGSPSGTAAVNGTLTMTGGTTLRIPTLAFGVLPLSVNALAFTGESKVTLDINGGTLADGYYPLIKSATTLPAGAAEAFALDIDAAVTLPAGAEPSLVVRDNALILQVGDVSELPAGVWVGGVDSNMSNPLNWKNLSVPAAGDTLDFSGVASATTVNADIPDITFATLTAGDNDITIKGSLNLETITNGVHVTVAANSTLTIEKDAVLTGSGNNIYMFHQNLGTIDIKGDLVINTTAEKHALIYYLEGSTGTIKAGGVLNNDTKNTFTLCGNHATPIKWEIGANGLRSGNGAKGFSHYASGNGEVALKAAADFTVAAPIAALAKLKFDTTTVDGAAGKITLEKCLENSGQVTIAGTGRVVANGTKNSSTGQNSVTVESAATLAVNAGKMISTGAITVNSGAALEIAQSGTVALGGDLTLADGATLKFNFTDRKNPPVLDLTSKGVTLGDEKNVTVVLSGERPRGKTSAYVLTEGGQFSEANVALASRPAWVEDFGVDADGNIFVKALANGLMLFVR